MTGEATDLLADLLGRIETDDEGTAIIRKEDQSISQEQFDTFRDAAIAAAVERRLLITVGYDPMVMVTIAAWRPAPQEPGSGGSD